MSSLDARYIQHLRQCAKDRSVQPRAIDRPTLKSGFDFDGEGDARPTLVAEQTRMKKPSSYDRQEQHTRPSRGGRNPRRLLYPRQNHEQPPQLHAHFDAQGQLQSRKLFNSAGEPSVSEATLQSRIAQPASIHAIPSTSRKKQSSRERGCTYDNEAQVSATRGAERGESKIARDHWQSLIALHRTLLHEHHDFFLASQHPLASHALRRLATKYTMPARMWKHGIHSFLGLLWYRLPDFLEFMISFIYIAYQKMSLLYETVPAFEDTWIECLGDLGRYHMAIEDEDIQGRETWARVARSWYNKAADLSPEVGRLYHHLAILARPNGLQQLYLYSRSLTSIQIIHSARESILTLFNPLMDYSDSSTSSSQLSETDLFLIKTHAEHFRKPQLDEEFFELLDDHIGRVTAKWREQGAYIMIANIGSLYDFGTESSLLRLVEIGFSNQSSSPIPSSSVQTPPPISDPDNAIRTTSDAHTLMSSTAALVRRRIGDKNVLPFIHILLSFLSSRSYIKQIDIASWKTYVAGSMVEAVLWKKNCSCLNTFGHIEGQPRADCAELIRPGKGDPQTLPEDNLVRGKVWSQSASLGDWFKESEVDGEEKSVEHATTIQARLQKVRWLVYRIAVVIRSNSHLCTAYTLTLFCQGEKWINYDHKTKTWSPIPREELQAPPSPKSDSVSQLERISQTWRETVNLTYKTVAQLHRLVLFLLYYVSTKTDLLPRNPIIYLMLRYILLASLVNHVYAQGTNDGQISQPSNSTGSVAHGSTSSRLYSDQTKFDQVMSIVMPTLFVGGLFVREHTRPIAAALSLTSSTMWGPIRTEPEFPSTFLLK
jgi:hypothetical protein